MAFEVVDTSLLLLAILTSTATCGATAPRFALVAAGFEAAAVGFVAFLPAAAFPRVVLGFSTTILATVAVAAMAADLAGESCFDGESCFEGDMGFSGEAGRERCDFCGEPSTGRIGEWGRVRELEDLGERTVQGLVTCRLGPVVVVLVRFLGLGIWPGSGVFSLSAWSRWSLEESVASFMNGASTQSVPCPLDTFRSRGRWSFNGFCWRSRLFMLHWRFDFGDCPCGGCRSGSGVL